MTDLLTKTRTAARLAAVALLAAVVATPAVRGAVTVQPVTPPAHRPVALHPAAVNPHLHGLPHTVAGVKPDAAHPKAKAEVTAAARPHSRWSGRWDSTAWFALHRGTGVIQGEVRNAAGEPMGGMDVRLRDRWGHGMRTTAAKHITHTGPGGAFLMLHVRAGSYRVHTGGHGHEGATPMHLRAGQIALVNVKA